MKPVTRRSFLKVAAASVAAPLIVPRLSFAAAPSGRLQHAAIGVDGQGGYDLGQIFSSEKVDVVALCDIDEERLKKAAAIHPKARLYRDWREMLDEEEKNIDSVNVSTPDHMHAPAAMTALCKGKHVFCEKPLTHEVYEARRLTEMAREKGVVTQMGIQCHASDFYRVAVMWLEGGAIGKVKEWHSWSSAIYTTEDKKRPYGADPIPANIDWDLWLGVAPERPYKDKVYHNFWWRNWRDFGGGATADFGCHIFDPVFGGLKIGDPISVKCLATESQSDEVWPGWTQTEYVFPGTAMTAGQTITATWMDGGKQPAPSVSPHLPKDYKMPPSGSMVIGEEGTMIIPHFGVMPTLFPEEKFKNHPVPEIVTYNHYHEFVNACLGEGKTGANFDFAGPMTEAVLLGNIANRFPGETLEWNAKKMRFNKNLAANAFLKRRYRHGWKVKGL